MLAFVVLAHAARFAVVYLLHDVRSMALLRDSYDSLRRHFNAPYDVVMFASVSNHHTIRTTFPDSKIVVIDESEWTATSDHPALFKMPSVPQHPGFDINYRRMGRYVAGFMMKHPALAPYDLVMKIDDDVFATKPFERNPFETMASNKKRFGYWMLLKENPDVIVGLASLMQTSGPYKSRPIILDETGAYNSNYFYGCVLVFDPRMFSDPAYHRMFLAFEPNFVARRWDEQKIITWWVAKTLDASQIECLTYVHFVHSEWARSARC